MNYSRKTLIEICEDAIVPQDKWRDRDSESAQKNIGRVWQLLKCGCEFEEQTIENSPDYHSDEDTIIIKFWVHNFNWFESGSDCFVDKRGSADDSNGETLRFYIPTRKRLNECVGKDWY